MNDKRSQGKYHNHAYQAENEVKFADAKVGEAGLEGASQSL
jgi:hypothetical protein